jgi:prepilin-type N-terminal cleavage/methylation domain-containing protein
MNKQQRGFTAVEVLVTIIIGALFLLAFYQLYVAVSNINARSTWLANANQVAYAQVQEFENMDFEDIVGMPYFETDGPIQITDYTCRASIAAKDFSAELADAKLPGTSTGYVCAYQISPTLKYIFVTATYNNGAEILQYNSYIQETRTE